MQLDGQGGGAKKYPNALQAFPTIVREEGFGALYKGVQPALLRQATYGSVRIGLYEPVKTAIAAMLGQGSSAGSHQQPSFLHKALSGIVCGALAAGGFTPMDVVKIRMQADGMLPAAPAPSPLPAASAGAGASAAHVASSTAASAAARHSGVASAAAGAAAAAASRGIATTTAVPVPPVSAAAAVGAAAAAVLRAPRYRNVFHAFAEIGRTEGLRGLYKGVSPTVQRAGEASGAGGSGTAACVFPACLQVTYRLVCTACSCRCGGGAVVL